MASYGDCRDALCRKRASGAFAGRHEEGVFDMSKRIPIYALAVAAATAGLALTAGVASASSAPSASAAKLQTVSIVMADPGCHWFSVAGKHQARLVITSKTAFLNQDEAALVFTGKNFQQRVAVGKSLAIGKPGVYHVKMVGQHPDDNNLVLVVT
jgi:hypothetical protein